MLSVHSTCVLCLFLSQDRLESTSCPVHPSLFSARTGWSQPPVLCTRLALSVCFPSQDRSDSTSCPVHSALFSAMTGRSQPPVLCIWLALFVFFLNQDRPESISCRHSALFLSQDRSESTSCPVHSAGALLLFSARTGRTQPLVLRAWPFSQPGQVGLNLLPCAQGLRSLSFSQPGQVGLNLLPCALCLFLSQDRSESISCPVHSVVALCFFLRQDRSESTSCRVLLAGACCLFS